VFADNFGGDPYAFHAGEVTVESPLEYGVYECEPVMLWQKMPVDSFTDRCYAVEGIRACARGEGLVGLEA
jgi:hypothetical protein